MADRSVDPTHNAIEIPLVIVDDEPTTVCGDRSFVLYVEGVGRIEVGTPLPDDRIWDHFEGDLMYTTVRPEDDYWGWSGGGGETWDHPQISALWSEPGSGDNPNEPVSVVIGRIPNRFVTVLAVQGETRMRQRAIRGHVAFPLSNTGPSWFEIYGIDAGESETLLFSSRGGIAELTA